MNINELLYFLSGACFSMAILTFLLGLTPVALIGIGLSGICFFAAKL